MVEVTQTTVGNVLTRTSGFLRQVTSHSIQPYRGCTFGGALCGVGCYVQHSWFVTRGRSWGQFLEVRANTAKSYLEHAEREARWARRTRPEQGFSVFCSSATDPFLPQEARYGVTRGLLESMVDCPPDRLILQTHSDQVLQVTDVLPALAECCDLRVHLSIESDLDRLPGLPPPACSVAARLAACAELQECGISVVVTVAPLLPMSDPVSFFARVAQVADAVVIDHFVGGDGSPDGRRTRLTPLPEAMQAVCPESTALEYRQRMVDIARRAMPGRVGVNIDGFAGRYLVDDAPHPHLHSEG